MSQGHLEMCDYLNVANVCCDILLNFKTIFLM